MDIMGQSPSVFVATRRMPGMKRCPVDRPLYWQLKDLGFVALPVICCMTLGKSFYLPGLFLVSLLIPFLSCPFRLLFGVGVVFYNVFVWYLSLWGSDNGWGF